MGENMDVRLGRERRGRVKLAKIGGRLPPV